MASSGWDSEILETDGLPQGASTPILSISDLQTLGATLETAYQNDTVQPIQPGHEYGAAISIRYPDGSIGPISVYNGSALAVDNIPDPRLHYMQAHSVSQEAACLSNGSCAPILIATLREYGIPQLRLKM